MALKDFDNFIDQFGLSELEKKYIQYARSLNGAANIYASQTLADFVLSKNLRAMTDDIIDSSAKLSLSNIKYAKALSWLTGGLVFIGILQIILRTLIW